MSSLPHRSSEVEPLLVTYSQAAKTLSLSVRTVALLVARGELPAIRVAKKAIRISTADIERFIDSRRTTALTDEHGRRDPTSGKDALYAESRPPSSST